MKASEIWYRGGRAEGKEWIFLMSGFIFQAAKISPEKALSLDSKRV